MSRGRTACGLKIVTFESRWVKKKFEVQQAKSYIYKSLIYKVVSSRLPD